MSDIESLQAYAGQLSEAAAQAKESAGKQHEYIHGSSKTDVLTESGLVPTIAKQAALGQAQVTKVLVEVASQLSGATSFDSIEEGLRSTVNGGAFTVRSSNPAIYLTAYVNRNGVAVFDSEYPTADAIESKVQGITVTSPLVPIVADDEENVGLWFDRGNIDAKGVGPQIRKDIGLTKFEPYAQSYVPLWADEDEKVPIWLTEGNFDAKGLGPQLVSVVKKIVDKAVSSQPIDLNQLLTTKGKTLWLYKTKRALLNSGAAAKLKVMFYGDSWSDLATIPNRMGELLGKDYAKAGYGWISALMIQMKDGVTATRPGFTLYDASNTPLPAEYGCAFDGASISTMLSTASVKISNLLATQIVIYYRGGPGTFRYRVDGGAWTVAPKGTLGVHEKIIIDSLPDTAHVLDIDTAGNTSNVTLYGFYATRDASGYEILKCGRGGLRGGYALKYMDIVPQYAADLEADLLIINLGTNDYRSGDWQGYVNGLTTMIAKHREGRPDVGVIIVCPPDSNGVAAVPLTLIREKGYQVSRDSNCEFADVHSIFPKYARSNFWKLWLDYLHLNDSGADMYCDHIFFNLMQ